VSHLAFWIIMAGVTRRWTAAEDARLRELAGQGLRRRNIAIKLSRTEVAVKGRARRLGIEIEPSLRQQFTEKDLIRERQARRW